MVEHMIFYILVCCIFFPSSLLGLETYQDLVELGYPYSYSNSIPTNYVGNSIELKAKARN